MGCAGTILAATVTTLRLAGRARTTLEHLGRVVIPARRNLPEKCWRDDARRTPMSALEAVLRRDRAVVIAALAILTAVAWADLVWLANDMWMDGMDMAGFRMIPVGQGWMMPVSVPWRPIE